VEAAPARVGGWVPAQNRTDTLKLHPNQIVQISQAYSSGMQAQSETRRQLDLRIRKNEVLGGGAPAKMASHCPRDQNAHLVSLVTGYHRLFSTKGDLQHLLPGAAHALPQHWPPSPWHGKLFPFTFSQQRSPFPTQTSPQQLSPPAHMNFAPCRFEQVVGES